MKHLYFLIILLLGVVAAACVILLLNFTAPNPTGRRYSSAIPVTTGQGSAQTIGLSGESVLALDLKLPRNDQADQRQCICNSTYTPPVNECRVCFARTEVVDNYRRPDFVGANFIAESKNSQNLLYTGREVDQIRDYAAAAQSVRLPLWLYVRVNTLVAPEFTELVRSTRGDVVYYFTVAGYADPVDLLASRLLIVVLISLALLILGRLIVDRLAFRQAAPIGDAPKPPAPSPTDPLTKSEDASEFARRAKDRAQRRIDTEDSRKDDL